MNPNGFDRLAACPYPMKEKPEMAVIEQGGLGG
jgi:hypothetical protein